MRGPAGRRGVGMPSRTRSAAPLLRSRISCEMRVRARVMSRESRTTPGPSVRASGLQALASGRHSEPDLLLRLTGRLVKGCRSTPTLAPGRPTDRPPIYSPTGASGGPTRASCDPTRAFDGCAPPPAHAFLRADRVRSARDCVRAETPYPSPSSNAALAAATRRSTRSWWPIRAAVSIVLGPGSRGRSSTSTSSQEVTPRRARTRSSGRKNAHLGGGGQRSRALRAVSMARWNVG